MVKRREEHFRKLENMMDTAPFARWTGAKVTVSQGEAEIRLTVREDFYHSAGAMHGALYFLALDNAAWFAANSLEEEYFVYTISFTTYITRPVSQGTVRAVGKVVNENNTQFIAESILYDEDDEEIARANGIFVRSKMPLSPKVGYG
jgi:uncharacterized protein (TIGR00369 family)